ncbi:MAG: RnfABCDGE type electron transport complex subunit C [Bacilli bacterium]|nr:RnfABCDGE type electron transport complex subunit C [Bacilli bacterium]
MRGIKLEGHKDLTKDKKILIVDKPKYVYIPLICNNEEDIDIRIRKGSIVSVGSILAMDKKSNMPIHSSISGRVVDFVDKYCYTGNVVKTIQIENDFKDTKVKVTDLKEIDKYTKKEFLNILKECGIKGMGGANFPTYIKYDTKTRIKHLIINAVECEPYITADYRIVIDHAKEIIETIDAIMTINKIEHAYIAIKKNNKDIIKVLDNYLSIYPRIKIVLVPNIYPMGWERKLVNYILHKDYNMLPIELDAVVNNVSTIYAIYNALKYKMPITSRLVTIVGDGLKKGTNVDVKIGQDISEVLDILGHKKRDLLFISGGPMMGKTIEDENFVVTGNVNAILLIKNDDIDLSSTCLRCGKCTNICPAKLSPIMIKENINNVEELEKLNTLKCIECGLCSYICPAKILLREYVIRAKKNVRGE